MQESTLNPLPFHPHSAPPRMHTAAVCDVRRDTEKCDAEKCDTEKCDAEKCDTKKCDTEKCDTEKCDTEKAGSQTNAELTWVRAEEQSPPEQVVLYNTRV